MFILSRFSGTLRSATGVTVPVSMLPGTTRSLVAPLLLFHCGERNLAPPLAYGLTADMSAIVLHMHARLLLVDVAVSAYTGNPY